MPAFSGVSPTTVRTSYRPLPASSLLGVDGVQVGGEVRRGGEGRLPCNGVFLLYCEPDPNLMGLTTEELPYCFSTLVNLFCLQNSS